MIAEKKPDVKHKRLPAAIDKELKSIIMLYIKYFRRFS